MSAGAWGWPPLTRRCVAVLRRNFLVWRKTALTTVLGDVLDPVVALLALGFGLGALLPGIEGVPYVTFLSAGSMCVGALYGATFEATYNAFAPARAAHLGRHAEHAAGPGRRGLGGNPVGGRQGAQERHRDPAGGGGAGHRACADPAVGAAGAGPGRPGFRVHGAGGQRTGARLRVLHVLLHAGRHAHGVPVGVFFPASQCRPRWPARCSGCPWPRRST